MTEPQETEIRGSRDECSDRAVTRCPACGREVGLRSRDGVLYRHDNRNNSGYCTGSLRRPNEVGA